MIVLCANITSRKVLALNCIIVPSTNTVPVAVTHPIDFLINRGKFYFPNLHGIV